MYIIGKRSVSVRQSGVVLNVRQAPAGNACLHRCRTGLSRGRSAGGLRHGRQRDDRFRRRRRTWRRAADLPGTSLVLRRGHQPVPPRRGLPLLQQPDGAGRPVLVRGGAQQRPRPHLGSGWKSANQSPANIEDALAARGASARDGPVRRSPRARRGPQRPEHLLRHRFRPRHPHPRRRQNLAGRLFAQDRGRRLSTRPASTSPPATACTWTPSTPTAFSSATPISVLFRSEDGGAELALFRRGRPAPTGATRPTGWSSIPRCRAACGPR